MIKKNIIIIASLVSMLIVAFMGGMLVERNDFFRATAMKTNDENLAIEKTKVIKVPAKEPNIKYGINLSEFVIIDKKVEKNEVLADILLKHNVAYQSFKHLFSTKKDTTFNPAKIKAGNTYTVLGEETDTGFVAKKIIYEENKVDYVVFNLEDSLYIFRGKNKVERKQREIAGVISTSLYETFDAWDVPPSFAARLAEIFSSTIDFYKVKEGDKFKIIFSQDYVEGQPIGVGEISAVLFEVQGKEYYAFYYEKDKMHEGEYYDENGNSMRKAFLKSPVKYGRISSKYSLNRFHPVAQVWRAHLGTDYAAAYGTPILATADGVVEEARYAVYNGNYVKIRHNGEYKTQYLHMSKIGRGVRAGKRVKQGETIGYVGSTGLATGPHVCYRFWKDGKQVDPYKQKLRFSEAMPKKEKAAFLAQISDYKNSFDALQYNKIKSERELAAIEKANNELYHEILSQYF